MLDNNKFDMWAKDYDKSVGLHEEKNIYPFAGYKNVLNTIYNEIKATNSNSILDLGFGTATLTQKLYDDGYAIFGVDFSKEMILIAQNKMPKANLLCYNFKNDLPEILLKQKFDFIISTYAIHHLDLGEKVSMIKLLHNMLNKNGTIIFGDVAFKTNNELIACKNEHLDNWDNDEIYIVFEEIKPYLEDFKISFKQISHCSGLLYIEK